MTTGQKSGAGARPCQRGLAEVLRRCQAAYAAGRPLLLLFDYDGTLVPLCRRPEWAKMVPSTRRRLARLARRPRVAVGIISGRCLDDLRRMCLLKGILYVGTGGLEWDLFGKPGAHPRAHEIRRSVASLYRRLAQAITAFNGAWVENKHFALSVHYRQLTEAEIPKLLETVAAVLAPYRPSVRVVPAPKALEIYPELGWDKGSVVRWLAKEVLGPETFLLYAGDAANDQPALDAVESLGGVPLAVGPEVQAAYALSDPKALDELLASLDAQLPGQPQDPPSSPRLPT